MKQLSTADALQFAIHALTCRQCAAATEQAEVYVRATEMAGWRWEQAIGLDYLLVPSFTRITETPGGYPYLRFDLAVCKSPRTPR